MKKNRLLALSLAAILALPTSFINVAAEAADYSGTNVVTELPGASRTFFSEDSTKEDWFNISGYAADGVQDRSQYYEEYVKAGKKDTAEYKVVEEDGYWKNSNSANREYISKEAYDALDAAAKESYRFVTAEEQFTAALDSGASVIQVNAEELDLGYYYLKQNNIPTGTIGLTTDYTGASKQNPPQTNPCLMNKEDLKYANSIPLSEGMTGAGVSEFSLGSHTTLFSTSGCRIRHCGISLDRCEDVVIRNFQFDGIYEWDDLYTNEDKNHDYTTRKRYGWCYIAISNGNDIWIDHCTFGFAFDGNIDIKNGSSASLTWCQFGVQDISDNGEDPATTKWQDSKGSELWKSILFMEEYYQKYKKGETNGWHFELYTKYRDQGATPQELLRYAAMHSKVHLCGSGEDSFYTNVNEKITLAFNYYTNIIQRIPMIRQGNGHMYNCIVDNTEYTANSKAMKKKGVDVGYSSAISVNNARDGASIGTDTCIFKEVDPACGVEYQGMDLGNVNKEWQGMVTPMVNHNLVVNSRIIKSDGTDYTGSSWDNNGSNPLTKKWSWGDKASLGDFKWSLWANQDQFAAFSTITNKLEGVEGILQKWLEENGASEYYKQFYIGSDELGYDYECFQLNEVEEKLATYGGAQAGLFDAEDTVSYITPYTSKSVENNYKAKVVIDVNGGTLADKQDNVYYVEAGKSVTLPTADELSKKGHNLAGWKKVVDYNADGTPVYGEVEKEVTVQAGDNFETVYYVAEWEIGKYTVSFETFGGTEVAPMKDIVYGTTINKAGGLPTKDTVKREGFSFIGWYSYTPESGFGSKILGGNIVSEDTTFYAKWRPEKVDVKFETDGGSAAETIKGCEYNKTITLPETTKEGYEFVGWYSDKEMTKQFKETTKVTESLSADVNIYGTLTLYAKWEENQAPQTVTLSFDAVGGTTQEAISVTPGEAVGELPTPSKAENVFAGWYADAEYTTEFTSESVIEADTTIYAKWALKGDVTDDEEIDANDALKILKYVAKMDVEMSELQLKQANVSGEDETVDANDALQILKYVAKMITSFDA